MEIEHDSIPIHRLFCPTRFRPFTGYAINSYKIFEFARFEKLYPSLSQTELIVYSSEFKYNNIEVNSIIKERQIGKIIQKHDYYNYKNKIIEVHL